MSQPGSTAAMSLMFRLQDMFPASRELPAEAESTAVSNALTLQYALDSLRAPTPAPAPWLAAVERRIEKSIQPNELQGKKSDAWLSQAVVNSAVAYLRSVSDLLPSEPYLYGSGNGGLIAEFRQAHGRLLTFVLDNLVQTITVVDGMPIAEKPTPVWADNIDTIREELKKQVQLLSTGRNGGKVGT